MLHIEMNILLIALISSQAFNTEKVFVRISYWRCANTCIKLL